MFSCYPELNDNRFHDSGYCTGQQTRSCLGLHKASVFLNFQRDSRFRCLEIIDV